MSDAVHDAPDPAADLAAAGWRPLPHGGFAAHAGPILYKPARDGGLPLFAMAVDGRHTNVHGIVHGGALMTFADTGLGITVWEASGRKPCVTVQFGIQFLDAVHPGEFVELDAEVLHRSSSVVFVRGMLRCGARRVASAEGVWKLIKPKG